MANRRSDRQKWVIFGIVALWKTRKFRGGRRRVALSSTCLDTSKKGPFTGIQSINRGSDWLWYKANFATLCLHTPTWGGQNVPNAGGGGNFAWKLFPWTSDPPSEDLVVQHCDPPYRAIGYSYTYRFSVYRRVSRYTQGCANHEVQTVNWNNGILEVESA